MFPLGDDNTSRRTVPVVTYILIVLNVLFFFVELSGGERQSRPPVAQQELLKLRGTPATSNRKSKCGACTAG